MKKFIFLGLLVLPLAACKTDSIPPIQTDSIDDVIHQVKKEVAVATNQATAKAGDKLNSATAQAADVLEKEILSPNKPIITKEQGTGKFISGCYVIRIADGDTATCLLEPDKTQVKIRFAQIDAPESKQEFGTRSKQALSELIFNKHVDLKVDSVDRYGRTVAEVYINGINVNKAMVQNGYAWAYKEYSKDPEYMALQEQARANKVGLWSHKNPIYPQEFRKQQAAQRAAAKQSQ